MFCSQFGKFCTSVGFSSNSFVRQRLLRRKLIHVEPLVGSKNQQFSSSLGFSPAGACPWAIIRSRFRRARRAISQTGPVGLVAFDCAWLVSSKQWPSFDSICLSGLPVLHGNKSLRPIYSQNISFWPSRRPIILIGVIAARPRNCQASRAIKFLHLASGAR